MRTDAVLSGDDLARMPRVRVHTRLVPNGMTADGARLRATLLLTPELVAEGAPGGVRLDQWPAEIHRRLRGGVDALVVPVAPGADAGAGHVDCNAPRRRVRFRAPGLAGLGAEAELEALCGMWLGSLWQTNPDTAQISAADWRAFGEKLALSLQGKAVSSTAMGTPQNTVPDPALYGEDGQLAPSEAASQAAALTVVSALDIRHADLALALEDQRACALATSLAIACDTPAERRAQTLAREDLPEEDDSRWTENAPVFDRDGANQRVPNADLIKEIAQQVPRGTKEAFGAYVARLAGPISMTPDAVERALFEDERVIAELRRRRRIGERTALFKALGPERADAAAMYTRAQRALRETSCIVPPEPEWTKGGLTPGAAAAGQADFDVYTRAARYANWPQYRTDADKARQKTGLSSTGTQHPALEDAMRAYFTLQSTPSLARVAMLAVDLELDPRDTEIIASGALQGVYVHMRADLGPAGADFDATAPRAWTLCRLRPVTEGARPDRPFHFWPASREEADCQISPPPPNSMRHFGGLMVMGFGCNEDPACHIPRFDVTTLDIRTTVELELQRRTIAQANQASETERGEHANTDRSKSGLTVAQTKDAALPPGVNLPGSDADIADEGDRQDVGLTLLDRGLSAQAIRKMAARDAKIGLSEPGALCDDGGDRAIVLDAEDLITGYRVYVGTPAGTAGGSTGGSGGGAQTDTRWHPLMARSITFGKTGPRWTHWRQIEPLLGKLLGPAGSPERVALESASLNVPGRMLPTQATPSDGEALTTEAVFEQAVSVWDGGPMGVDCAPFPEAEKSTQDTLIFGRELSIPEGPDYAIPRLRYGRPYRFALAAVFSGGRSLGAAELPADAGAEDIRSDLYYPSARMVAASQRSASESAQAAPPRVRPYIRALRQAKIGAPQVLITEGHAMRVNGPMGPDQSGLMLVRSLDEDPKNPQDALFSSRERPLTARRVVVIPSIPLARAAAHMGDPEDTTRTQDPPGEGVFDRARSSRGGLTFVQQQAGGGFPALKTTYLKGLNGVQHFDRRAIETAPSETTLQEGQDIEAAVFKAGSAPNSSYYPDPAVEALVVRVRLEGGQGRWFTMGEGLDPVDLVEGQLYPTRRRALVTLTRRAGRDTPPQTLSDLVTLNPNRRFNPDHGGNSDQGGGFRAREIALQLAPHEWAEIDMWLLPSARRLARDFAVIQALALRMAQSSAPCLGASVDEMCKGAGLCLPEAVVAELSKALAGVGGGQAFFGPGGVAAPPMPALLALAEAVRHCMIRHPIPELAAVTRLQAVHAANRATQAPRIAAPSLELTAETLKQAVSRPRDLSQTSELAPLQAFRPEEGVIAEDAPSGQDGPAETGSDASGTPLVCTPLEGLLSVAARGASGLVLSGDVALDLNQIDAVEVRARMAFPGSTTFDDKLRGRSLAQRRAGWWPLVDDPTGRPAGSKETFRGSESLFGFHVLPDEQVRFDRAEVTLLRAERLPRPGGDRCINQISLRRLFEGRDLGPVRITERHLFPDGKARRMEVWVNGLPRTAQFMRTADRRLRGKDPWVTNPALEYEENELAAGEDLRAEAQCRFSERVEVILPATRRPARPDARAPEPRQTHETPPAAAPGRNRLVHRRHAIVRIPLGREWFSSGEDERLGIVLWPPKIAPEDHAKLRNNTVVLRRDDAFGGTREIDLNDLVEYRLTKRKLFDILCKPRGGSDQADWMPFEDRHLGPGGQFVSRRGADPVREGNPHRQILFTPSDFPDLDRDPGDPRRAELVEMVEMPLSEDGAFETMAEGDDGPQQPPMSVALVTYAPRFDPIKELWYVDVTMEDSVAAETFDRLGLVRYQPHTRPDLRCSLPVRQFVQPLPDRVADVSRITGREGEMIRVRLSGPTFYRRRVSQELRALVDPQQDEPLPGSKADAAPTDGPMPAVSDPYLELGCRYEDRRDILHGADAAPRMRVKLIRTGTDAFGRPYRETIPLPVSKVGQANRLLLPADHDVGVISPKQFSPIPLGTRPNCEIEPDGDPMACTLQDYSGFFRLDPTDPVSAGSVLVEAAMTAWGEGVWMLKIPIAIFERYDGLSLNIEEVEASEPASPPSFDELQRAPVQSLVTETSTPEPVVLAGQPSAKAAGWHLGGARMSAVFDLSGWATGGSDRSKT